jgi:hypothetical protein
MDPVTRAVIDLGGIASAAEILQRRCSRDVPEDSGRAWKATGTRLVVSIDEALETIRRCQPPDVFHAIRRAANR